MVEGLAEGASTLPSMQAIVDAQVRLFTDITVSKPELWSVSDATGTGKCSAKALSGADDDVAHVGTWSFAAPVVVPITEFVVIAAVGSISPVQNASDVPPAPLQPKSAG